MMETQSKKSGQSGQSPDLVNVRQKMATLDQLITNYDQLYKTYLQEVESEVNKKSQRKYPYFIKNRNEFENVLTPEVPFRSNGTEDECFKSCINTNDCRHALYSNSGCGIDCNPNKCLLYGANAGGIVPVAEVSSTVPPCPSSSKTSDWCETFNNPMANAVIPVMVLRTGGSNWRTLAGQLPKSAANPADVPYAVDLTTSIQTWWPDSQFSDVNSAPGNQISLQFRYFAEYWLNAYNMQSASTTVIAGQGPIGTFTFSKLTAAGNGSAFVPISRVYNILSPFLSNLKNTNFYEYILDGNEYHISDGGGDMYDGGNYTRLRVDGNASSNLSYAQTSPLNVPVNGKNVQVISLGYKRPLVMLAHCSQRADIGMHKTGNIGADDQGALSSYVVYNGASMNGYTVYAWVRVIYNAGDPSIGDLFFAIGDNSTTFFGNMNTYSAPNTNNGDAYMTMDCKNALVGTILLSKPNGAYISVDDCQKVITNLVETLMNSKESYVGAFGGQTMFWNSKQPSSGGAAAGAQTADMLISNVASKKFKYNYSAFEKPVWEIAPNSNAMMGQIPPEVAQISIPSWKFLGLQDSATACQTASMNDPDYVYTTTTYFNASYNNPKNGNNAFARACYGNVAGAPSSTVVSANDDNVQTMTPPYGYTKLGGKNGIIILKKLYKLNQQIMALTDDLKLTTAQTKAATANAKATKATVKEGLAQRTNVKEGLKTRSIEDITEQLRMDQINLSKTISKNDHLDADLIQSNRLLLHSRIKLGVGIVLGLFMGYLAYRFFTSSSDLTKAIQAEIETPIAAATTSNGGEMDYGDMGNGDMGNGGMGNGGMGNGGMGNGGMGNGDMGNGGMGNGGMGNGGMGNGDMGNGGMGNGGMGNGGMGKPQ